MGMGRRAASLSGAPGRGVERTVLEFLLLGPLEVRDGEDVIEIRRLKQRALVAALALRAGELATTDRLVDDLWGERAPKTAKHGLENYVSRASKGSGQGRHRHAGERVRARGRSGPGRRQALRAARLRGATRRSSPNGSRRFARRSPSSAPTARRPRLRAVRDRCGAATSRSSSSVRARSSPRPSSSSDDTRDVVPVPRVPRRRPSLPRAPSCPADARALPIRSAGGGALRPTGMPGACSSRNSESTRARISRTSSARSCVRISSLRAPPRMPAAKPRPEPARAPVGQAFTQDGHDRSSRRCPMQPRSRRPSTRSPCASISRPLPRGGTCCGRAARRDCGRLGGEAAQGIFGVPATHEDDALRGVRAAYELREAVGILNDGLLPEHGVFLEVRTAVATGEVLVTPDAAELATGQAVARAETLERGARPGQILLGSRTLLRWCRASSKRKSLPDEAEGAVPALPTRQAPAGSLRAGSPPDSPLVGRRRQLAALASAFESAAADRALHLFTVLGQAGVGKSRLVREFVDGVEGVATRPAAAASRTARQSRTGR